MLNFLLKNKLCMLAATTCLSLATSNTSAHSGPLNEIAVKACDDFSLAYRKDQALVFRGGTGEGHWGVGALYTWGNTQMLSMRGRL